MLDMGVQVITTTDCHLKDWNESYYIEPARVSELHDLLSRHHRIDRTGVHMPVGNILKA